MPPAPGAQMVSGAAPGLVPGGAPPASSTGVRAPGMNPPIPGVMPRMAQNNNVLGNGGPSNRIDPGQMPRPLTVQPESVEFYTRSGNTATVPLPIEGTNFVVRDNGNASPRFMRPTMAQIPATGELLATSAIPFAILVQPFAMQHPDEEPIHVVDYGEVGPLRCERCKAYVNPFFRFIEHGRRVVCNMCQHVNEVSQDYLCHLGHDGKRQDWQERPELCKGSVDFVAPSSYMVRPPMPPTYMFVIEVSAMAIGTGVTQAACAAVKASVKDMPDKNRTLVSIITFDNVTHFYNMRKSGSAQIIIVPDSAQPFSPIPGIMVECAEYEEQICELLDAIPNLYAPGVGSPTSFGAAVGSGIDALKKQGGRLCVIACSLPGIGFGALSQRDNENVNPSVLEKEPLKLLETNSPAYKDIATTAAEAQIPVDLYFCPQSYVDTATTMLLPRTTGGEYRLYAPWNGQLDYNELIADVRWSVVRQSGWESVMRVRCSQGLHVSEYNGSFYQPTSTDLDIAGIDCDKAIMVCLRHGDKLSEVHEASFQTAILYTSASGQRRIRIHTVCYSVTSVLGNLYKGADLDCVFNYFVRWAASMLMGSSLETTKDVIQSQLTNILLAYRKYCAASSSSGQLILPEALKLLPLYILSLLKSSGMRTRCMPDIRSEWLCHMSTIPSSCSTILFHPRVLPISCLPLEQWNGVDRIETLNIPELNPLPASSETLKMSSMYLVENGADMIIFIGRDVDSSVLQELFGVGQIGEITSNTFVSEKPNERSRQLHLVIQKIRFERKRFMRLRVTRTGDPLEQKLMSMMVEDRQNTGQSYVEFLCQLHRMIQNKNS